MDTTADPCNDWYRYACGGWLDSTPLPGDESRWARSFSEIAKRNRETLRDILENDKGRLGDYYGSCMDEDAIEARGAAPLHPLFERISGVSDAQSLLDVAGELQSQQVNVLFGVQILGDLKNPDTNLTNFFQGGLGLPDRDYYLSESHTAELDGYGKHVAKMLTLLGEDEGSAAESAASIVAFETELAKVSRTRTEMRDVERLYNRINLDGLQESTPSLPWKAFFAAAGYPEITDINVGTPEFFTGLDAIVADTDPVVLQAYLRWQVVSANANRLPAAFVDENFRFFSQELSGQKEQRPRWRRCVAATGGALSEELGSAFVERKFAGDSKEVALEMIHGIEGAFEKALPGLDWMDPETRTAALEKMHKLQDKIGYPDVARDYSAIEIHADDYFGNALRADAFAFRYEMDKAGKPVDKTEWGMPAHMVNAYYNPQFNEIVFPAGILQEPFFNRDFPSAMNFGAIGAVMGHELTHGYDDMGRRFDPDGKMVQWWNDEAVEAFTGRAQCVDDLYSGFEVQPDLFVNGKLTLGENIADFGGIKQAYEAFTAHSATSGDEQFLEELTDEQLFFVAFGQVWCQQSSDEMEKMLIAIDSHSPGRFRATAPVANMPQFAEAFHCDAAAAMNPPSRCEVW